MPHKKELIQILQLAVNWQDFKEFCKTRTDCIGCPYYKNHICSITTTEKMLKKISKAARNYLIQEGLPLTMESESTE